MPQQPKHPSMSPRQRKEIDTSTYEGRFAQRLRLLREKAKLTPQDVADTLKITLGTIYHWEAAHSFPKPGQLLLLAKALNLKSVRTLFPEK